MQDSSDKTTGGETRNASPVDESAAMPSDIDGAREFAGKVGHDLNNLLMIIQGGAHFMELTAAPGSDQAEIIGQVRDACRRAEAITRQLLDFALSGKQR